MAHEATAIQLDTRRPFHIPYGTLPESFQQWQCPYEAHELQRIRCGGREISGELPNVHSFARRKEDCGNLGLNAGVDCLWRLAMSPCDPPGRSPHPASAV